MFAVGEEQKERPSLPHSTQVTFQLHTVLKQQQAGLLCTGREDGETDEEERAGVPREAVSLECLAQDAAAEQYTPFRSQGEA